MNNLLTVLITLLELAPESGRWVCDRMIWSMTSQIVGLTGDLRGAKNPADWVETQRSGLLRLLGRMIELSGNGPTSAVDSIEGHMQYLENKEISGMVMAEDQLALMRAAGASEESIKEYMVTKNLKNQMKIGIKQRAIQLNRNAFKAEVEGLIAGCINMSMHEKEIKELSLGTQKYLSNGIQSQIKARVSWLMDNIMYQAGELTLLNSFVNGEYMEKLIHALEEETEQVARAGYEPTDEVR